MSTVKITPAMKKWCVHLSLGRKVTRSEHSTVGPFHTDTMSGLTYVMAHKLEETGLIVWRLWEPPYPTGKLKQVQAVLTAQGWKAAGKAPSEHNNT